MGLDDYISEATKGIDYSEYDDQLAAEIDKRIQNDEWLSKPKQPYYVVKTAEYALAKSYPPSITDRRIEAQKEVLERTTLDDLQSVQDPCHRRLFQGHEDPPNRYGDPKWHQLFDEVLGSIETERRSGLTR